jgi:two-component sensor histidine kinase
VRQARALLDDVLEEAGIDAGQRSPALLVASELVTNAIMHGSSASDRIDVAYTLGAGRLSITVCDAARAPSGPFSLAPDEARPTGRGLNLVERLAEWSDRIVDGRREVRAVLIL